VLNKHVEMVFYENFLKKYKRNYMPEKIVAIRGENHLSEKDLQAHIASLVRLENIGVFLGAGASSGELGGKTLLTIWKDYIIEYPKDYNWLKENRFINGTVKPNPEAIIDALEIARIEQERSSGQEQNELREVQSNLLRCIVYGSLLQKKWWENPTLLLEDLPQELRSHQNLLQKLTTSRQPGQASPWIFTTNYDLALEWSAESLGLHVSNGFLGLHARIFSPHNFDLGFRNNLAKGEARFGAYNIYLVKLHGSLSWIAEQTSSVDQSSITELSATAIWDRIKNYINKKTKEIPCQMVIPGTSKYTQTTGFVFGELFRRFSDFLGKSQSVLFISGYSFGDEHLNRILRTALQNPTLQIVIFLPELKIEEKKMTYEANSEWFKRLSNNKIPQITFVGGGKEAYFSKFVEYLPDPALFDKQSIEIRSRLKDLDKKLNV
jgi:hypothetical protein